MTPKNKLVLPIALAAIALTGCMTSPRMLDSVTWTPCDASRPGARCDVRVVQNPTGKYSCDAGRFDVQPDYLQFRGGKPVTVIFSLPSNDQFCASDGPALKSSSLLGSYAQLYESFGADKNDGSRTTFDITKACRSVWVWNWANMGTDTHEYLIRFRDRDGRQCLIDPYFMNG
jgi:hypothetical protein